MNALQLVFGQFWPAFATTVVIFSLVQLGRRSSLQSNAAVFTSPKSFRELSAFSKDDQKRLLHEADSDAFGGCRAFLPALVYAAIFSGSIAAGSAIPKIAGLSDSLWLSVALGVAFICFSGWLARRWEVRSIRPCLTKLIRRTQHAA